MTRSTLIRRLQKLEGRNKSDDLASMSDAELALAIERVQAAIRQQPGGEAILSGFFQEHPALLEFARAAA